MILRSCFIALAALLLTSQGIRAEEAESSDDKTFIEATLIGRYMSNHTFFANSPYAFVLFDSEYGGENWIVSGGVFGEKGLPHPDVPINHLYVDYFTENSHLRIGKMVAKVGVLDYFSMLDTLNPIRLEFFDDSKVNIKRVPVWMAQADYFPVDELKLSFFIQPYDSKYQDYSGYYVDYTLNHFVPQHYHDFFHQDPIGQDIFAPVYYNAISPFISHEIESKKPAKPFNASNLSLGLGTEYTNENGKFGFLYFNRYSEVPLIRVDQNLLDAAVLYDKGEDISPALNNYLASMDLDPIKSVQGFRYQQAGIYAETTMDSFGIRAEAAFRDKVPLLNTYGSVGSFGFAIDYLSSSSTYYALEAQCLHLSEYNKNAMIAMFTTKYEPVSFSVFRGHFENRVIGAAVDSMGDIALNPSFSIEYDRTDLVVQGIVSANNSESNSVSILLRSSF